MRRPANGTPGAANRVRADRVRQRIEDARSWGTLLRMALAPRGWIPGGDEEDQDDADQ